MAHNRMTLWSRVRQLEKPIFEQIKYLYDKNFPLEFRMDFSELIEHHHWSDIEPDDDSHYDQGSEILTIFLKEITRQSHVGNNYHMIAERFEAVYGTKPLEFVRRVKMVLHYENMMVQKSEQGQVCNIDKNVVINFTLDQICQSVQVTEKDLMQLNSKQEQFIIDYQDFEQAQRWIQQQKDLGCSETLEHNQREAYGIVEAQAHEIMQQRKTLAKKHQTIIDMLEDVQYTIIYEKLSSWKDCQARAKNGGMQQVSIQNLQIWCEILAQIIKQCQQQIRRVEAQREQLTVSTTEEDVLSKLNGKINKLLYTLVSSTFIIEKQPPQVLKTNTRFAASVRMLVGGKINVESKTPTVKVSIISEKQARKIYASPEVIQTLETAGQLINAKSIMDQNTVSVEFVNMLLQNIKRSDRRNTESVTEEKFALLFQVENLYLGGSSKPFPVSTMSLPIVVIVHGTQEANAAASILWDNAFSQPNRIPFEVPSSVPWCMLINALDYKWMQQCGGSKLTVDAKEFLSQKLFPQRIPPESDMMVNWTQFNRRNLGSYMFTFWQWFNGVMELIKSNHCRRHWLDQSIIGFIGKSESEQILFQQKDGTFILRFSDSSIGGLATAMTHHNKSWHLEPQTVRMLAVRGLADQVNDFKFTSVVTRGGQILPKEQFFSKYYTTEPDQPEQPSDGYVRPILVRIIPQMRSQSHRNVRQSDDQMDTCNRPQSQAGNESGPDSYNDLNVTIPHFPIDIEEFLRNNQ